MFGTQLACLSRTTARGPIVQSLTERDLDTSPPSSNRSPRGTKILAKTIYKELRSSGVEEREVLAIASEMLRLVADEMRGGH